ncbi:MAG: beta-galactosidase trimerization domain-containing protein, partial [Acidobacteria bacterium]|nr:beta-galactosidase trimerization domain-containing protein [Acidobacteriota bacterium]
RQAGVKQWLTTDCTPRWLSFSDDPGTRRALDIAAFNVYQPNPEPPRYAMETAWHFDKERSAHGLNRFLTTETRIGYIGDTISWDPVPSHEQFRMWMFGPVAYGSTSLMYWSGNRWRGGPWPQFGGVLDWSGKPEPDVEWLKELGAFFEKWGQRLVDNPVKASVAVLTDFDQRSALQVYRHTPASPTILPESFEAFHRLGMGVDSITGEDAARVEKLRPYSLIVLAADTALDGSAIPAALKKYVEEGGRVLITPFTAYQSGDGVFRDDGFGANLADLTGTMVRTGRRMGTARDKVRKDQVVLWSLPGMRDLSTVGVDGYCELMDVSPDAEVIARFKSEEPILNGRPAAVRKKLGKGSVIKLAFWSQDDSFLRLFRELAPNPGSPIADLLPFGIQAVPRSDGSIFILNTSSSPLEIPLTRALTDRITGRRIGGKTPMKGYEVFWLE